MKLINFISTLSLVIAFSSCSGDNHKEVKPDNKAIDFEGRFVFESGEKVIFDWPGTYFRCRFTGSRMGLKLEGSSDVKFNVFIDQMPPKIISCNSGETIWVAEGLNPGIHTLLVVKRTEAFLGKTVFKGLIIDPRCRLLRWENFPEHRIEFIGNSITCGYGVEGENRNESFKPETENSYLTYAAILARTFNADYSTIAHSGLGVVRHYGDSLKVSDDPQMPEKYLRTLDSSDSLKWDFSLWKPDMVMINLGTNDFSTLPYPDKDAFKKEYEKLIQTIRKNYGDVPIFCAVGPLIGEPCFSYVKEAAEKVKEMYNDKNIVFIGIPKELLNCDEDFGSDEHPSITGQKKIADYIAPFISGTLGWNVSVLQKE